jgi:hypothetical protein
MKTSGPTSDSSNQNRRLDSSLFAMLSYPDLLLSMDTAAPYMQSASGRVDRRQFLLDILNSAMSIVNLSNDDEEEEDASKPLADTNRSGGSSGPPPSQ